MFKNRKSCKSFVLTPSHRRKSYKILLSVQESLEAVMVSSVRIVLVSDVLPVTASVCHQVSRSPPD